MKPSGYLLETTSHGSLYIWRKSVFVGFDLIASMKAGNNSWVFRPSYADANSNMGIEEIAISGGGSQVRKMTIEEVFSALL